MNIIIIGPQGSGKGTQAKLLAEKYDLDHIEMGAYLRRLASLDTPLGREINETVNVKKKLISSQILDKVLKLKLSELPREKGVIFDGVPRKLDQSECLDRFVLESGRKLCAVIFVNISDGEAVKRISKRWMCKNCKASLIMGKDVKSENDKCPYCDGPIIQRKDDTPEGVKKRLSDFKKETLPVVEKYRKKDLLLDINGEQTIEGVFTEIESKLGKFCDES